MRSPSPSTSSSSATPEPQVSKLSAKSSKGKGSKKPTVITHGKNEGVDPNWAYKPPSGAVLLDSEDDAGEFDWDEVNDDKDVELWLIRVPESVKPKYLENVKISLPSSSKSNVVGSLKRKHATFDIWSLGVDDEDQLVCGEEIKGLSCLLPRKSKKGKLYPAPKPITRHLVVSAHAASVAAELATTEYKNPPRECYPKDVLTHVFMPYGSLAKDKNEEDATTMDVDTEETVPHPKHKVTPAPSSPSEPKKSKSKKRKGDTVEEAPTPKKLKKSKAAS